MFYFEFFKKHKNFKCREVRAARYFMETLLEDRHLLYESLKRSKNNTSVEITKIYSDAFLAKIS